jgi:predicted helicase
MALQLDYESAELYPLKFQDVNLVKTSKVKRKSDKDRGLIFIDDNTTLINIPASALDYKLGNCSSL